MSVLNYLPFSSRIIFRTDGNSAIGLGHVVRCQALAQALQPEAEKIFVLRGPSPALQQQLAADAVAVQQVPLAIPTGLPEADWLAGWLNASDILVLDGYHFSSTYQRILAATGAALVCLDDLTTPPNWASVVLNQAGGVGQAAYDLVPIARLYLGPTYALLRAAFWQRSQRPNTTSPPHLFLNMGGADPTNQTMALLPRLREQFPNHHVEVVTGAAYPYQAILQNEINAYGPKVSLHHNLNAAELASLLQTCHVFVCPPSGVAYECCAAGGAMLLHQTADNQRALFEFLVQSELAIPLVEGLTLPESQLTVLAAHQLPKQRAQFDGLASQRLQKVFAELADQQTYAIHRAAASNVTLYFDWANDPVVRQHAINPESIAWHTHVAWFTKRLQDADTYLYIMTTATGEPVGQVRIEFDTGQLGHIDYSVGAHYRGRGLGTVLLERALQRLRHERPALAGGAVLGYVQADNIASARVFERLRFMRQATVTLQGEAYSVFRLNFPLDS
ncbi:MAG: UDP-2,4-diacetamido-2,4,6-trideoxy-beta-L-altropyranose hydrolase [Janthinobacterium lividum]